MDSFAGDDGERQVEVTCTRCLRRRFDETHVDTTSKRYRFDRCRVLYASADRAPRPSLLPLDVLHELEVGSLGLDLVHGSGCDLVDEVAEDDAVAEDVLVGGVGQLLAGDGLDPLQHLLLLVLVAGLQRPNATQRQTGIKRNRSERKTPTPDCFHEQSRRLAYEAAFALGLSASSRRECLYKLVETFKIRRFAVSRPGRAG